MDRLLRLRAVRDYLPAFRAVAESEHLPTASRTLGVSPPALSRAIHLLEDRLGHPLFDRAGARLRLNPAGQHFLAAVRNAMRALDEGVDEVVEGPGELRGELRVAFPALAAPLAARWLAELGARAPALLVREIATATVELDLRRGALDVALVTAPPADETLATVPAAAIAWHLYARRGRRPAPPWRVIVPRGAPWPADGPGVICAEVADPMIAALAAGRAAACAFVPDEIARAHGLSRLGPISASTRLHAAHRRPVAHHPRTEVALAALRAAAA